MDQLSVGGRLAACEAIIDKRIDDVLLVGKALLEIRTDKLYRETHTTFEAYCQDKWGHTRKWANAAIQAVQPKPKRIESRLSGKDGSSVAQSVPKTTHLTNGHSNGKISGGVTFDPAEIEAAGRPAPRKNGSPVVGAEMPPANHLQAFVFTPQ